MDFYIQNQSAHFHFNVLCKRKLCKVWIINNIFGFLAITFLLIMSDTSSNNVNDAEVDMLEVMLRFKKEF
jgi:hypothetical protein